MQGRSFRGPGLENTDLISASALISWSKNVLWFLSVFCNPHQHEKSFKALCHSGTCPTCKQWQWHNTEVVNDHLTRYTWRLYIWSDKVLSLIMKSYNKLLCWWIPLCLCQTKCVSQYVFHLQHASSLIAYRDKTASCDMIRSYCQGLLYITTS